MDPKNKDELTDVVSNRSANDSESNTNRVESPNTTTATDSKADVVDFNGECNGVKASSSKNIDVEWLTSELTCSICSELFVKPVTLNCSHTFCERCIDKWREKNEKCPYCRVKIETACPTNIVNNCIGKVLESASGETKRKREEMIDERSLEPQPKKRKVIVIDDCSDDERLGEVSDEIFDEIPHELSDESLDEDWGENLNEDWDENLNEDWDDESLDEDCDGELLDKLQDIYQMFRYRRY